MLEKLNEISLLHHEYEYGDENIHNSIKILGIYTTLKEAINAINRYCKIKKRQIYENLRRNLYLW